MVKKLKPDQNEVYFINKYTMMHILEGSGGIQVDFKNYFDWADKIIFLEKGQYIKFLTEDFVVRKIDFDDELIFRNKEVRVLFKHLVSLGYINFNECGDCQKYLNDTVLTEPRDIIDISSRHWYWQNPFNAKVEEYHVIFDIKDLVDQEFKNHLSNGELVKLIGSEFANPHSLLKTKIGLTVKNLLGRKRLTESKKQIAFTDKSIKEISYDFGFKDPAYFSRVFKENTGKTPGDFREGIEVEQKDSFIHELYELLHEFQATQRNLGFYAEKFHLSEKSFSRKVKNKLQISVGQLIRQQLIITARQLLIQGYPVHEVAMQLGFEENNHFSTFFKHYTGMSPSDFQNKKYKK